MRRRGSPPAPPSLTTGPRGRRGARRAPPPRGRAARTARAAALRAPGGPAGRGAGRAAHRRDAADEDRGERAGPGVEGHERAAHREDGETCTSSSRIAYGTRRHRASGWRAATARHRPWKRKTMRPAATAAASSRQSLTPTGGVMPRNRSGVDPAAETGHPGQHHDAEDVESQQHRDERPRECEDEDADQVQEQLEGGGVREHRDILAGRLPARTSASAELPLRRGEDLLDRVADRVRRRRPERVTDDLVPQGGVDSR